MPSWNAAAGRGCPLSTWDAQKLARLRELQRLQTEQTRRAAARSYDLAARYLYDPAAWARDVVVWPAGSALTDYQEETLEQLPRRRRVALRGPHGLGKSTTAAIAVWWLATTRDACRIDWKVITTASAWRPVRKSGLLRALTRTLTPRLAARAIKAA